MAAASQRWLIILVSALVVLAENGLGQSAVHWSFYKTADGLPGAAVDSISFTPQGKLIASSINALTAAELDGYSLSNFPVPAGFIGRICESPGGQRWALAPNGLLEFKNGAWLLHPVPEISADFQSHSLRTETAPPFFPVRQGCVIFLLPQGLMEFSAEDPDHPRMVAIRNASQMHIGLFTGMAISPGGRVWICGSHGIAEAENPVRNISPETLWQEFIPPRTLGLDTLSSPKPDGDGKIIVVAESGTNHQKVVAVFGGRQWTLYTPGPENFFCAWRGPHQKLWAATADSLFEWNEASQKWVDNDEISAGRIFDVEVEPGGAFWLATSGGLIRGSAALWQEPLTASGLNSPVESITADHENRIYFIADNQLQVLENGQHQQFLLPPVKQTDPPTYALFPLVNAPLLIKVGGTCFQFLHEQGVFKPFQPPGGQDIIPLGYLPVGSLCFQTPGASSPFEEFDGGGIYPWNSAPAVNNPEARFTTLFVARNGDLWMGGPEGVFWRHGDQWQSIASQNQAGPEMAVGFAETPEGKIWCATTDELWEFDGKNWLLLQNKFNHINALKPSRDGSIWLASNGGLFRFYKGAWLETGVEDGFPNGPAYAVCEDDRGQIWAATAHGLRVFHPEANPDPPKTFVHQLAGNNPGTPGTVLTVLLQGQEKWKFALPGRLLYSYQLDQGGWSPFQEMTALSFPDPTAGKHYFQVRAIDPAGNLETAPAMLNFTIPTPWFREIRLWVVLVLGLGGAMFFAAVAWNRHRQLVLSHAAVERKVAERTRELEVATRELLHSQKMNALGTLAAGIAHDFNNILSIIKGSAQIIEDNTHQPEKILTRVARIKTVVQQGAEIVDAMLGFSRNPDAQPASCNINEVIADTVKLLGDRFLREVEIKFERTPELPEAFVPREFIQQILLNFIFNASESMSGPKEITLATKLSGKLPPDIFLAPAPSESFILICVSDRGTGIAPEIKPRIFEPFFTTKALSARRGTGLGLSMVYELAKKMNAGLAVHSVVGQGSMFILILPVSNQEPPTAHEPTQ